MSVRARRIVSGRSETVAANYAFDPLEDDKIIRNRLLKSQAVVASNLREKENFNELKDETNRQIMQAQADIEDLKKQLEESKVERQHKEECEAIRKLISAQPPRSETQKVINELNKEIAELEAENTASWRLLELRKKQFALFYGLMSCRRQWRMNRRVWWKKCRGTLSRKQLLVARKQCPSISS